MIFKDIKPFPHCAYSITVAIKLLNVYIDHNSGGTPHNRSEIDRIRTMMASTPDDELV